MANKQPATPLPWTGYALTVTGDSLTVCEVEDHVHAAHDNSDDAPANAAYIVHACNAYPQLVKALRKLTPVGSNDSALARVYRADCDEAEALLKRLGE